jgi:hypothetical protein
MRKFLRPIPTVCLITLLAITSCSYLENDGTEIQEALAGNILLQKQKGARETLLVLRETAETYAVLVENCDSVFYDQGNRLIWVKSIINENNSVYYQLTVMDTAGTSVVSAIQKKEISKQDYTNETTHRVPKWVRSGN